MRTITIAKLIIFFLLVILSPSISLGGDLQEEEDNNLFYVLYFNNRLELKRNFLNLDNPENLTFTEDSSGYYFYAGTTLLWFISDDTELDLTLDSGTVKFANLYYENGNTGTYINNKAVSEYIKKTLFISELFIESDSLLNIKIGKLNINNSTPFVFDDYVFGIRAELPLLRFDKGMLLVGAQYNTLDGYFSSDYKKSPFAMLDLSYKKRRRFLLSCFTGFLYDNDSAFGKVYQPFVTDFLTRMFESRGINSAKLCGGDLSDCIFVDSRGYLLWSGVDIDGRSRKFSYRLTLILNYGKMELNPYIVAEGSIIDIYNKKRKKGGLTYEYLKLQDSYIQGLVGGDDTTDRSGITQNELPSRLILGYLFFGEIGYKIFNLIKISPYFLFMSGENDLEKSGYLNSFVSVKSYITLSNIFFNGGLNETATSRNFSMAGVNGYGVLNPGLRIEIKKDGSPFVLNTGFMKFYSAVKNSSNKRDYGSEFDIILSYEISDLLQISCEADYFIVGSFFDKNSSNSTDNPLKLLLGLNLFLDNID